MSFDQVFLDPVFIGAVSLLGVVLLIGMRVQAAKRKRRKRQLEQEQADLRGRGS